MNKQKVDFIIQPQYILPIYPKNIILKNHSIVVKKNLILDIVKNDKINKKYIANKFLLYKNSVLMPGLINSHTHIPMNLFRGLTEDMSLMKWLNEYIWPAESKFINSNSVKLGSCLAIAEMIRGGITCFNDHYFFSNIIANVIKKFGIRAILGNPIMNIPTKWAKNENEYIEKSIHCINNFNNNTLLDWSIAPHSPYTNSDSSLLKSLKLSQKFKKIIHIHLHETKDEINMSIKQYGKRPIERLFDLGLINNMLLAVHMTHLNNDEIDLLERFNVNIVHCPESNMKLASGFSPVNRLLNLGINVSLGTDGAASNNDLDMLTEMRTAAFISKGYNFDSESLPVKKIIKMATINGAKSLHINNKIGSIEKNKLADFILIDINNYWNYPVYNPMNYLIYNANRLDVNSVFINGKLILYEGKFLNLDVNKFIELSSDLVKKNKKKIL